jgi:murein L,D-transpeptidase YafK
MLVRLLSKVTSIFFLSMFMLYCTGDESSPRGTGETQSPDVLLLKKVAVHSIQETFESSKTLDDAAQKMGLESRELEQLCHALNISIPYPSPVVERVPLPKQGKKGHDIHIENVILDYHGLSPYVILVEKDKHTLYLIKYEDTTYTVVDTFDCKTGKNKGDKREEGDHKTPEGAYFFVTKYSRPDIRKVVGSENTYKYGEMAFVTNFPNPIDSSEGKDGRGIWLHGTDEPFSNSSPYDSRGCVVTTNETIKTLGKYIQLHRTPMVVVMSLNQYETYDISLEKRELTEMLDGWRSAWEGKRTADYLNYYSSIFTERGMNLSQWKTYKKSIAQAYNINHIKLDNIILLRHSSGFIAQFTQDYSAENLSSKSSKTLYLMRGINSWQIIAEKVKKVN